LNAKIQVDSIADAFAQADPGNATSYHENAATLKERLDELDDAFRTGLENRTKNDIVNTHEGFNYLAKRYGFNSHAAIGISGDEQPSAQDLIRLTDLINELDINYVFGEPTYSDAIIEQISTQTGAELLVLDGIHGQSGVNAEKDYFEIMYANLESLKIGLEVNP
jgi:zinc transport system substrate-binding protein